MSNTLLNYFTKSPSVNSNKNSISEPKTPKGNSKSASKSSAKKQKDLDSSTPKAKKPKTDETPKAKKPKTDETPKAKKPKIDETPKSSKKKDSKENETPNGMEDSPDRDQSVDDYESDPDGSGKKRKRVLILESDGSEDEYIPESDQGESSESEESVVESTEPESNMDTEDEPTPKKDRNRKTSSNSKMSSSRNTKKVAKKLEGSFAIPAKPKIQSSQESNVIGTEAQGIQESRTDSWPHLKFDFLKPDKIRDIKNRKQNDPDYDPRTLRIPEDFKKNLTPAHKQWWDMKATYFDCVLFFKVGKFYELFHMDAVIGVNELNLTYMKGDFAHSGFPEIAYGRFATTLVEKGYKVARIEQTETPDMMEKRCKTMGKVTKFDKVVKREICQITSKGTRIYSVVDGGNSQAEAQFLLAICEKKFDNGSSAYGVCFIDTSIGIFHVGQFIDDKQCSRLRTLVAHYPPAQILYERGQISKKTQQVLNVTLSAVLKDALIPDTEFWGSSKTLLQLVENTYFDKDSMPEPLKIFLGEGDSLGLTANEDGELAVRSLGAVTWYLKRCQLDHQLLSMKKFSVYLPVDSEGNKIDHTTVKSAVTARHMVLDAVTLRNLHVLENSSGGVEGTLLHKLDNCCTAFGKRLLYQWMCSPLYNVKSIISRQEVVSTLIQNSHVVDEVKPLLTQLPDLERLLSRIYAQSTFGLEPSHPENRAIMFEEKTYSKKRIVEFTNVLSGYQNAQKIAEILQDSGICNECDLLRQCCHFPDSSNPGQFPDLSSHLTFFKNAFDHDEALKEGRIIPSAGVDAEYDCAVEALKEIEVELKKYLQEQCTYFCAKVTFVGTDKKRYQLEVPDSACKRAGSEYEIQGQRKGYKRFWTPKCKDLLERQIAAEDLKTSVLQDLRRRIFSRFSERTDDWRAAVQCLSVIDVLISMSDYSKSQDGDTCVPKFEYLDDNNENVLAVVSVESGRYPCSTGDEVFIPNDTVIGAEDSSLVLVTGPNMGGKSTLMRQLGLIVILAQMGCHVPATSVFLNPVDRIFTRLGANDDIMSGESTFFMELSETSAILKHATKHSLVLIDELGRGTSTYDGTAIAASVLRELTTMKCRTLFSTHYHSLVEDFKHFKAVKLGHMSCMAETDEEVEGNNQEMVTFLYKFAEGACPKSYGFNAARLAGVPNNIIKLGQQRAKQLEHESHQRKLFKLLFGQQQQLKLREKLVEIL
ncbi:DNA mismatch repair protein Msh6 [Lycorma delicatula]|uniref:DNA mismatch repair protein Msh6 n=1 Tax=Lycorma delicatula TaxID=130591 RepID=UPI003F511D89